MKTEKKITVIMLGLDNSGKTTTVKGLIGEAVDDVAPTWGFSSFQVRHGKYKVAIHDLGGGKNIRKIWQNYFAEAYGVIYVVDASDAVRVEECRDTLHDILKHPKISGKPLLILANKQDVDGALDETDVCCALDVENIVNEAKICTRVEMCTALRRNVKKQEKEIQEGFNWLITMIGISYTKLRMRVEQETADQKEFERNERVRREERVQKLRAERKEDEEPGNTEAKNFADPFRPLTEIVHELNGPKSIDRDIGKDLSHSNCFSSEDIATSDITNLEDDAQTLPPLPRSPSHKSDATSHECLEFESTSPTSTPALVCTPTRQILVVPITPISDGTHHEDADVTVAREETPAVHEIVPEDIGDCKDLTALRTNPTPIRQFFTRNNKTSPADVAV